MTSTYSRVFITSKTNLTDTSSRIRVGRRDIYYPGNVHRYSTGVTLLGTLQITLFSRSNLYWRRKARLSSKAFYVEQLGLNNLGDTLRN